MSRARDSQSSFFWSPSTRQAGHLARRLLTWYDSHGRELPWRRCDGVAPDPYRVWLSEIMLQQTTVATVRNRFDAFIERWPDIRALAGAELDQVLTEWSGLGYYARARNLHRCARLVAGELGSKFPDTEEGLRALPGIGAYTAAAIASIAFGRRAAILDGNVERVLSRLARLATPLPKARPALLALAKSLTPTRRPGDYAQAAMDLGATICTPVAPKCPRCPWMGSCLAYAAGDMETYPRRLPRPTRPRRYGIAFWVTDRRGNVALRRRPPDGLLGAMMEVPGTAWRASPWSRAEAARAAPSSGPWRWLDDGISHVFTHFSLDLSVAMGRAPRSAIEGAIWLPPDRLGEVALPTIMRKIAAAALRHRGPWCQLSKKRDP